MEYITIFYPGCGIDRHLGFIVRIFRDEKTHILSLWTEHWELNICK
jgi:hypothetical protein